MLCTNWKDNLFNLGLCSLHENKIGLIYSLNISAGGWFIGANVCLCNTLLKCINDIMHPCYFSETSFHNPLDSWSIISSPIRCFFPHWYVTQVKWIVNTISLEFNGDICLFNNVKIISPTQFSVFSVIYTLLECLLIF